ncbi:MAG: clan AA aspartic protease [Candidatus Margulisiibacteriota bacterium]
MGLIHTKIALKNPKIEALNSLEATALVDTGALHLCIPEHVALQLGYDLNTSMVREVTTADSKKHVVPYVGPIQITFQNRSCFTGALVLGDEVLLGAVPMEDMDLILSPAKQAVMINPENPNIPGSVVKSFLS